MFDRIICVLVKIKHAIPGHISNGVGGVEDRRVGAYCFVHPTSSSFHPFIGSWATPLSPKFCSCPPFFSVPNLVGRWGSNSNSNQLHGEPRQVTMSGLGVRLANVLTLINFILKCLSKTQLPLKDIMLKKSQGIYHYRNNISVLDLKNGKELVC